MSDHIDPDTIDIDTADLEQLVAFVRQALGEFGCLDISTEPDGYSIRWRRRDDLGVIGESRAIGPLPTIRACLIRLLEMEDVVDGESAT